MTRICDSSPWLGRKKRFWVWKQEVGQFRKGKLQAKEAVVGSHWWFLHMGAMHRMVL